MRPKALWRKRALPYLFIMPAGLMMLLFLASSVGYNIGISFFRWNLSMPTKPFIGLANYVAIFTGEILGKALWNSIIWTVSGIVLQMFFGILLALAVDRLSGWRAGFMRSVVLLPWLIPGVVTTLIWVWMFQADLGVVNNVLFQLHIINQPILWFADEKLAMFSVIMVNTWKSIPFWFLMITAALRDLPQDQVESARIDGARYPAVLRHIILPHLKPIIAATCTLTTIWTFNYFDLIWVATKGGPLNATSTLPVYTYRLAFESFNYGQASALSVVSLIIVALFCIPYIRSMFGSVKEGSSK